MCFWNKLYENKCEKVNIVHVLCFSYVSYETDRIFKRMALPSPHCFSLAIYMYFIKTVS